MLARVSGLLVIAGVLMLLPTAALEPPVATTIRSISTAQGQYSNRAVAIRGRFRGRLVDETGSIIQAPKGRWDFLLEGDGQAVWVSGRRPAGPDFDLNPVSASEVRLGRWLDVTGTVRLPGRDSSRWRCPSHQRCATWWIDATDLQLHREQPPHSGSAGAAIMLKRPIVVFHDPVAEEADVRRDTRVRLQFSRQMAAETFGGRVRVAYDPPGRPAAAIPAFTAVYHEHTRGLEIRFGRSLEPHCTVKLELLEGIRALDGRVLLPWTMTFTTGNGT